MSIIFSSFGVPYRNKIRNLARLSATGATYAHRPIKITDTTITGYGSQFWATEPLDISNGKKNSRNRIQN